MLEHIFHASPRLWVKWRSEKNWWNVKNAKILDFWIKFRNLVSDMKQAKLELCGDYWVRRTSSPRELSRVKGDWLHPLLYRVSKKNWVFTFYHSITMLWSKDYLCLHIKAYIIWGKENKTWDCFLRHPIGNTALEIFKFLSMKLNCF